MSFGWGPGDIITAVTFVYTVVDALQSSGSKYQETEQWLSSLAKVLERLKDDRQATARPEAEQLLEAVMKFKTKAAARYGKTLGEQPLSRWRKAMGKFHALQYRFLEDDVTDLRTQVQESLATISLHLEQDVKDITHDTQQTAQQAVQLLLQQQQQQRDKVKGKILKWLNPVMATENKFDARKRDNVAGSGQWLLQTDVYRQWLATALSEEDRTLLWITGIPGSGKTSLATSVVQELQTTGRPVAFFYCDTGRLETTSLGAILRTWLWQLLRQWHGDEDLPEDIVQAQTEEPEACESVLKTALRTVLQKSPRAVLVLDALDECPPESREDFLRTLPELLPHAHCLVLSRLADDIVQLMGEVLPAQAYQSMHIQAADTAEDMRKFLAHQVGRLRDVPDAVRVQLAEAMEQRADGMFQWAVLVVGNLLGAYGQDYLEVVAKAPRKLNDLYGQVLAGLWNHLQDLDACDQARHVLQWLACAQRPLSLREMGAALNVTVDAPCWQDRPDGSGGGTLTLRQMIVYCGALVTLSGDPDQGSMVVSLAHASVKDYLMDARNRSKPFGDLIVDEQATHALLGRVCLTYLCYDNFPMAPFRCEQGGRGPLEQAVDAYLDGLPLQRYAATQWPRHVLAGDGKGALSAATTASLLRLCRSEKSTIRWLQAALRELGDRGDNRSSQASQDDTRLLVPIGARIADDGSSPAVYAAWLAHLTGNRADKFFSRWQRFMWTGEANDLPSDVHVAANFDFVDYLRAYLDGGGDPDVPTFVLQRPLHFAARCECVASARLLVDRGANVCANGWAWHQPLSWAVDNGGCEADNRHTGRFDVAALLLDAGADPFAPGYEPPISHVMSMAVAKFRRNPGDAAAQDQDQDRWLLEIAEKMLERDTAARQEKLREVARRLCMLHELAAKGPAGLGLLRFFLRMGVDVNSLDAAGRTPVDVAVQVGNNKTAPLLRSFGGMPAAELLSADEETSRPDYWPQQPADVFAAYLALRQAFSRAASGGRPTHALLVDILDRAAYWLRSSSVRDDRQVYNTARCERDTVYLRTLPTLGRRRRPVCAVRFCIDSHDQGFSDYPLDRGTFENSWTWFEFDVLAAGDAHKKRNRSPIQLTHNLHAIRETSHYRIAMSSRPGQHSWIDDVEAGDQIVVHARALYPGWENHVERVSVDIYTRCLLDTLKT